MTGRPKRIQLRRVKGWRLPPGTVHIGRPSRWGNPFRFGPGERYETRAAAVAAFRAHLAEWPMTSRIEELRGKDLACWCPLDEPCHGDVLLQLANRPPPTR